MADMGTPAVAGSGASDDAQRVHDAAVAFSQGAGARMKAADVAVTAAKAALAVAIKAAVVAHAEAAEANGILAASSAAINGAQPSQRWYWIAGAVAVVVIAAAVAAIRFV